MIFKKILDLVAGGKGYNPKLAFAGKNHIGSVRTTNEDNLLTDSTLGLAVVCDGMGGHSKGELASKLAVATIRDEIAAGMSLEDAILSAHRSVCSLDPKRELADKRPGSTVVVLKIDKARWKVGWVGDSRVWLFHKKKLIQLTYDHTVVQQMVNWGDITYEESLSHPDRNRLSQALGIGETIPAVGLREGALKKGMVFLLATDGMAFWNEPDELAKLLANFDQEAAVDKLIASSLEAGGHDNVSCVVVTCV